MTALILSIGLTGVALGVLLHALGRYQKAKKEANKIAEEFIGSIASSFKDNRMFSGDKNSPPGGNRDGEHK